MRKTKVVSQAIAWAVIAVLCAAALAWYSSSWLGTASSFAGALSVLRVLPMLASPLLVFAVGALFGLAAVRVARLSLGRVLRGALKVIGTVPLLMLAVNVFVFALSPAIPAVQVVFSPVISATWYVAIMAPALYAILGLCFSLGYGSARSSGAVG